jgi:hypothetical protein
MTTGLVGLAPAVEPEMRATLPPPALFTSSAPVPLGARLSAMLASAPAACSVTALPIVPPVTSSRFSVAPGVATSSAWLPGVAPSVTLPAPVARSTSAPPALAASAEAAGWNRPVSVAPTERPGLAATPAGPPWVSTPLVGLLSSGPPLPVSSSGRLPRKTAFGVPAPESAMWMAAEPLFCWLKRTQRSEAMSSRLPAPSTLTALFWVVSTRRFAACTRVLLPAT